MTATRADKLIQFTLAKTFRGELVPTEHALAEAEGRKYESAHTLLESIQEAPLPTNVTRTRRKPVSA